MTSKVNQRIFRSIVVAGAMLGTPLVAVADGKPGVTDAQPAMELVELNAKITLAVDEVANAQTQADRSAAKAKLAKLQDEKIALEAKLAAAKAKQQPVEPPSPALAKLEAQKQVLAAKVAQAVTAVEKADNDRDRSLAKEALAQLQREHASIESQIATERARRNVKYGTIGHGHGTGVGVGIGGSTPLSSFELTKLERQRIELVKEVPPLLASIQEARDDKARVTAKAKLDAKKAEIAGLDTKIATEKQRLVRVRGGTARPKGRGFVLA